MQNPHKIISVFPNECNDHVVRLLISEAAYYKAEKRGFEIGHEEEDWLQAEKEIKSCLSGYLDFLFYH